MKVAKQAKRSGQAKVRAVMHEYKEGELHSGQGKGGKPGPKVTSRKQAVAIALNEAGVGKPNGKPNGRTNGGRGR